MQGYQELGNQSNCAKSTISRVYASIILIAWDPDGTKKLRKPVLFRENRFLGNKSTVTLLYTNAYIKIGPVYLTIANMQNMMYWMGSEIWLLCTEAVLVKTTYYAREIAYYARNMLEENSFSCSAIFVLGLLVPETGLLLVLENGLLYPKVPESVYCAPELPLCSINNARKCLLCS